MELPLGYQSFHRETFFNYQLNRLHGLGYARHSDLLQAAAQIKTRDDYVRVFESLAAQAKTEHRLQNAAFYLRAAEFFVEPTSPAKNDIYRDFRETFDAAFAHEGICRHEVPYRGGFLPAMTLPFDKAQTTETILIFGGFDSLIEEFFVIWKTLAAAGYRVIAFEGPGQGGGLRLYGHTFDHDWEKPTAAMLDYFDLSEATLIGISMGGYWALRAAAFEPRIQRVVSWSPVYDWLEQIPGFAQTLLRQLLKWEGMMNASIRLRMRLFPVLDHAIRQAMYMMQKDQPMDAVRWMLGMNRWHLCSDRVMQDVLLLGGENDAFQPVKLLQKQQQALTNARSVTARIFTRAEHADMHCQMGNLNLALTEIDTWLQGKIGVADQA